MGYDLEVEMIRRAHEMDLLTCPYVFAPQEAEKMTRAGADILVPHMGLTTKGMIGAQTARSLDDCVARIQAMHDAAKAVNPDVLVLCHGGPISEPEDTAYVLSKARGIVGFFGASSIERLPTERAIVVQVKNGGLSAVSPRDFPAIQSQTLSESLYHRPGATVQGHSFSGELM